MKVLAGTSGFSYTPWKGLFYPQDLPVRKMLAYYATRLPAVEINNTFYRQPTEKSLLGWRAQVPASFCFALKAPRRITHIKKLRDCERETQYLLEASALLEQSLGALLFQLPPSLRADPDLLAAFAELLPLGTKAAFEFRHESWFTEPVYQVLAGRNFALAVAETDEASGAHLPMTANWAYLRLRKLNYADAELSAWLERLSMAKIQSAQVFFKHEDEAAGPRMAERLLALAAGEPD